jgi:Na+/H+ antiporter NhaD/arsenite permease-like protein
MPGAWLAAGGAVLLLLPETALAAPAAMYDGRALGLEWILPFVGLLLSMAIMPLAAPRLWHHHFGKIAAFWALCVIAPLVAAAGVATASHTILHTMLGEFVPFMIVIGTLYTITGGIRLDGRLAGTPTGNLAVLAVGTALASFMGTTGASMLLIRPLVRANRGRRHNVHVVVFFIFLVSNIGGALSPLGDPPLFLGFLNGVHFFWPTTRLLLPTALMSGALLAIFYAMDSFLWRREPAGVRLRAAEAEGGPLRVEGGANFLLLGLVLLTIFLSGAISLPGSVDVFGVHLGAAGLVRDAALVALAVASFRLTHPELRRRNEFCWAPVAEVAQIFAAIFVTIIPPLAILRAGNDGALSWLVAALVEGGEPVHVAYFWIAGGLSSFLDNAPTYLIFFHAAGGNAELLMGPLASTLTAISLGAVFMGANTYIGNAPNFMVKSIAESNGVRMPSFFGYMGWSIIVLLPLFAILSLSLF